MIVGRFVELPNREIIPCGSLSELFKIQAVFRCGQGVTRALKRGLYSLLSILLGTLLIYATLVNVSAINFLNYVVFTFSLSLGLASKPEAIRSLSVRPDKRGK